MKKFTKRFAALAACLVFALSMALTSFAADDSNEPVRKDGFSSIDGLEIKTTTDRDSYKDGEAITYTFSFTNTNDYALDNVKVSYKGIENLDYDKLALKKLESIGKIEAGETVTKTFTTNGEEPKSSVSIPLVAGIIAAVVIIVVVVLLIVLKGKKKGRGTTAMVLVGALLTGSMSMLPANEAQAVTNSDFATVGVHDPSIVKDPATGTY